MAKRLLLPLLALILIAVPVRAQEESKSMKVTRTDPKAVRFAPDFCDFEITFPEAPAVAKKCIPGGACYDVNSYTMVYDLKTTVDISVTCNPSTPESYEKYNEQVMKAALAGMVENKNLVSHTIKSHQYENAKSAAITGTGTRGLDQKIYSAQIWIGKNSVFTVQAELIGAAQDRADTSFRDILKSIKVREDKKDIPEEEKDGEQKPAAK